jgi:zinc D-Ala-D-Ala dipeptidase
MHPALAFVFAGLLSLLAACAGMMDVRTSPAADASAAGMVDVATIAPDIRFDMRYAGSDNFIGEPIRGYEAPRCFLHREVAQALARVQAALRPTGESLLVFDCYRPVRAVRHFVEWARDPADQRNKARYYPNLDKSALLGSYIAEQSGHSRGATLDVGLVRCADDGRCTPVDMGTAFDLFDPLANTAAPGITAAQRANRERLLRAMAREGFENYAMEWWHYIWRPEPTPRTAFDFPVR